MADSGRLSQLVKENSGYATELIVVVIVMLLIFGWKVGVVALVLLSLVFCWRLWRHRHKKGHNSS